jgi:hypothetical protein
MSPFDQCALLANRVVSTMRPDIDQKAADLTDKFPALNSADLRLRLWVIETIVVLLAGENSTADPARLERFFDGFWSDISRQLRLDLPGPGVRQEFDAGLDRLATEIESDREQLEPEQTSIALAKHIAAFLEVPELEPLEYGYKLATFTKLLNELPE